jgi:c-di-GMP-binding flagellar brake protein YcgR
MNIEKRQYVRAQVGYPVMVKSSQGLMVGQVKDISPGGAFICCQWPSEPGKVLEMTIRVSPMSPPLKAKGKVMRSRIYCLDEETRCHGMSVRFTKISDDDRRFISSLISGYLKSESERGTFEKGPAPDMVGATI